MSNYNELGSNAQKRFGILLHELCEVSGLSQGRLSRRAKAERNRLIKEGLLNQDERTGSMEQPAISQVMAGLQGTTYFQTLIWLRVLRKQYESDELIRICEERGIVKPEFTRETERLLWMLAAFVPPEERLQAYERSKGVQPMGFHLSIIAHNEERMCRNSKSKEAKR